MPRTYDIMPRTYDIMPRWSRTPLINADPCFPLATKNTPDPCSPLATKNTLTTELLKTPLTPVPLSY
jgi:hypothetical protein